MNQISRVTRGPRQQPLPFPTSQMDPWNHLTERQRDECRQAIRQLLLAIAQHVRNETGDLDRELSEDEIKE